MFTRLFSAKLDRHGMAWPADAAAWTREMRDIYGALEHPGRIAVLPSVGAFAVREQLEPADVVPCVKGFDFYSPRLRDVITANLTDADIVQWFPFTLVHEADGREATWWVMHPPVVMPIDAGASTYGGLTGIINGVIDPAGVAGRRAFKYPYGFPPVLDAPVIAAIQAAGCTGTQFVRVPTAPAGGGRG